MASARAAPGDHLHLGDAVVAPSLGVSAAYDDNVYLADGVDAPIVGAPGLLVEPRFRVTLAKSTLQLSWELGYRLSKLLDLAPNDGARVGRLDRFNEVDSSVDIAAFTASPVGFRVSDAFAIKNQPTEVEDGATPANLVTTSNAASGGLTLRPRSALTLDLLGQIGLDNYRVPDVQTASAPTYNNRASFGPQLDLQWSALPKSNLILDSSVTWYRWQNHLVQAVGPEVEGPDYGDYVGKPDALAWRARVGIETPLSTKIGVKVEAGLGQAYYDERTVLHDSAGLDVSADELDLAGGESFGQDLTDPGAGLLVDVQGAWAPVQSQSLVLGYRKDFEDAVFTNYIAYNYGYLRYRGTFWDRLDLSLEVGARLESLHGEVHRDDVIGRARGEVAYVITAATAVRLAGQWSQRACAVRGCEGVYAPTQYTDLEAEIGVAVTY